VQQVAVTTVVHSGREGVVVCGIGDVANGRQELRQPQADPAGAQPVP
jgi:hypothetical protein